jgi:hypothetical protein
LVDNSVGEVALSVDDAKDAKYDGVEVNCDVSGD